MSGNLVVDAKTRYAAAQSEISARLAIRVQIQAQHLVIVGVLCGIYFTLLGKEGAILYQVAITTVLPLVSAYFISLYARNDDRIGFLVAYNAALEAVSEAHIEKKVLPRWFHGGAHAGQDEWIRLSRRKASYGVNATKILAVLSPILLMSDVLIIAISKGLDGIIAEKAPFAVSIVVWCIFTWWNWKTMNRIEKFRYDESLNIRYDEKNRKVILPWESA